ncbi:MAG: dUTP diphosphatase [bacterium]
MDKIKIKRIDKTIALPEYKTVGAAAFDLMARVDAVIKPKEIFYMPLNVCIQIPSGHTLLMASRSSLHKRGLMMANSIAVFDEDFCGDGDEYHAALYNFTDKNIEVAKGDRLTQGFLVPITKAEWNEVESMENSDRGGFGSTGHK